MKLADLLEKVKPYGWREARGAKHAHHIEKDGYRIPVTNHPSKDIPIGTIKKIEKLLGIKLT